MKVSENTSVAVSKRLVFTCHADFHVAVLQWIHENEVVANTTDQQLDVVIDMVHDHHHNDVFTCRATTTYGDLEISLTVNVTGMLKPLMVIFVVCACW